MLVQILRAPSELVVRKSKLKFIQLSVQKNRHLLKKKIRSLKNLINKNLEEKWTYSHINQMQSFVQTINSKVNRVTMLAPNKVTKETFLT